MELRACLAQAPASDEYNMAALDTALPNGFVRHEQPTPLPSLSLPGCTLDLLVCGVGPVAAALALGRYLGRNQESRRQPPLRGILNLGIAGSYDTGAAPLGSLVLATEEVYPEYGVWPHQEDGQRAVPLPLPFPQAVIAGQKVVNHLPLEPLRDLGNMGLNWHSGWRSGVSVTVAGVSGTPQRAGHMAALGRGLTENMEGFSLALGAAMAGIPFAELRAISNAAGLRPPEGWDMPAALAALGQGAKNLLSLFFFADARHNTTLP